MIEFHGGSSVNFLLGYVYLLGSQSYFCVSAACGSLRYLRLYGDRNLGYGLDMFKCLNSFVMEVCNCSNTFSITCPWVPDSTHVLDWHIKAGSWNTGN